jgi:hypothetical protein
MRTKCPKQLGCFLGKGYHRYAPCPKIKPHSRNVWQILENPLAHPKCIDHLWPKCSLEKFMPGEIPNGFQSLHFNTLTLSPTRANWVERWSQTRVISLIGPMMWVSSVTDGEMQFTTRNLVVCNQSLCNWHATGCRLQLSWSCLQL